MKKLLIRVLCLLFVSFVIYFFTRNSIKLVYAKNDYIVFTNKNLNTYQLKTCNSLSSDCKVGLMDQEGHVIYNPMFNRIDITDYFIFLKSDNELKVVDYHHPNQVIKTYDKNYYLTLAVDGMAIIEGANNRIMLNELGKEIVLANDFGFKSYSFYNGFMQIRKNEKLGYLSHSGELIEPIFVTAELFNEDGYAKVCKEENKCGVINTKGDYVISPLYQNLTETSKKGFYRALLNGYDGIITYDNNIIVDFKYYRITPLENDYYLVVDVNDKYIIKENQLITYFNYREVYKSGKYIYFKNQDNKCGFYDYQEKRMLINPTYDECENQNDELFVVKFNNQYGIINQSNEVVLDFQYDDLFYKSIDFIGTKVGNKWEFINLEGQVIHDDLYDGIYVLTQQDYVVVMKGQLQGLVKSNGQLVLEPLYEGIYIYKDFLITKQNGKFTIVSNEGAPIFEPITADGYFVYNNDWIVFKTNNEYSKIVNVGLKTSFDLDNHYETIQLVNNSYFIKRNDAYNNHTLYNEQGTPIYQLSKVNQLEITNQTVLFTKFHNLYQLDSDGHVNLLLNGMSLQLRQNQIHLLIIVMIDLFIGYFFLKIYLFEIELEKRLSKHAWYKKRN